MRTWRAAILMLCALLAAAALRPAGASAAAAEDWPEFLRTSGHDTVSPSRAIGASNAATLGINWMAPLRYADFGSPVAAYNATLKKTVVYAGDENGDVFAFDESNGAMLWSASLGYATALRATPMVAPDGSLWVATSYSPTLWKLDGATGTIECSMRSTLALYASPQFATPPGGVPMAYAASIDSNAIEGPEYGIRQSDCAVLWAFTKYRQHSGSWVSAAYGIDATHEGRVYVGTADPDDAEYALDANTGKLVWSFAPGYPPGDYDVGAAATVSPPGYNGFAHGVLYFPTKYGIFYALDLTTGKLIWQYNFDQPLGLTLGGRSTASLDGANLVYGMTDGVEALNAKTGALLWHYTDPAQFEVVSSPAIVGAPGNKAVVVGDLTGVVHVLRLRDGADLYDYQTLNTLTSSPAIVNGHLLIDSADGFLYDLKANGAKAGAPTTAIASPRNGSTVPNHGSLKVSGSASDTVGLTSVSVAVQSGGPNGPWYDAATKRWGSAPFDNVVAPASPGKLQSAWSFSFPVPPSGSSYRVVANAGDANHLVDRTGAQSSFTVAPNKNDPQLTLSAPLAPPGGSVTASASGFAPNETIVFTLQEATVGEAKANASGKVSGVPIDVPVTDSFGPSALTATGKTSHDTTSTALDITNVWTQAGYSSAQTNDEPNDTIFWKKLDLDQRYLTRYWVYSTGAPIDASPAIVAGAAYVANDAGTIAAVELTSGAPLWTYTTPSKAAIHGSPAVSGGSVLFGSDDGSVYDVATANGTLVGSAALDGVPTAPSVAGSTAYAGTDNGSVYAIDVATGKTLWKTAVPAAVHVAPAVDAANGLVFAGDDGGNVTELNATTGARLGSVSTGGAAVTVAPALSGGALFVAAADGVLRTYGEATLAPQWTYAAPAAIHGLSMDGQYVYVGSDDGSLGYLAQANGAPIYVTQWGSALVGLSSAFKIAIFESANGFVYSRKPFQPLDKSHWQYQTAGTLTTTPALVDGAAFVGADDGGLYAFTFYNQPPLGERRRKAYARLRKTATMPARWTLADRGTTRETAFAFEPFGPRVFPLLVDRAGAAQPDASRARDGAQPLAPRRYAIVWGADARTRRAGAAALGLLRSRGAVAAVADATPLPRVFDDAAVQREIAREIDRHGWRAGLDAQFIVLTADGPARDACAYRSAFDLHGAPRAPVAYAVVQMARTIACGGLATVLARAQSDLGSDPLVSAGR